MPKFAQSIITERCPGSNSAPVRVLFDSGYCAVCGRLVKLRWGRTARHTGTARQVPHATDASREPPS